jgi:carbon monoxide dehydrogenase subunit G
MKLEQSFEVAAPLDRVWAALIDVERVAPCLPGADISGRNDDGSYNGTFRVKIGPTAAAYAGKLEMESVDEASHTATMQAAGTDRRGQGGATATIVSSVKETGPGQTVVEVLSDYSITGRLARFGRDGTIEEIGNRLLGEFAASLGAMLAGPGDYETFIGVPAVSAAPAASAAVGGAAKPEPEVQKSKRKPRKDLAAAADAVAAASEPPGAEPPAAEPEPEPVSEERAVEVVAEEELAAVVPEAAAESDPPAAEPAPPPPEPVPAPPPPPPAPEPPPAPPPPPAPEAEPLDGLALARTAIVERIKSNPAPLIALLLVLLLLQQRRRRRQS